MVQADLRQIEIQMNFYSKSRRACTSMYHDIQRTLSQKQAMSLLSSLAEK